MNFCREQILYPLLEIKVAKRQSPALDQCCFKVLLLLNAAHSKLRSKNQLSENPSVCMSSSHQNRMLLTARVFFSVFSLLPVLSVLSLQDPALSNVRKQQQRTGGGRQEHPCVNESQT